LSHSKQDSQFIESLANQLRTARIDVWYDEWEIPPGESIRRKIFDDGIPNCHVFFVYLTENFYPIILGFQGIRCNDNCRSRKEK
jgi:hypothetical protein